MKTAAPIKARQAELKLAAKERRAIDRADRANARELRAMSLYTPLPKVRQHQPSWAERRKQTLV